MPELGTIGDGIITKFATFPGTADDKLNAWLVDTGITEGTINDKIMQAGTLFGFSGSVNEIFKQIMCALCTPPLDPDTTTFNDAERTFYNT